MTLDATTKCNAQTALLRAEHRENDGTTVGQVRYGSGKDGAEVALVVIEGGSHAWPGREPRARWLGVSTRDIIANDMMWEFFQSHPME